MTDTAPPAAVSHGQRHGTVTAFDPQVGLGRIGGADGEAFGFHCVAIADGSRMIDPGTQVCFELAAGLHGRWEAVAIRPVG